MNINEKKPLIILTGPTAVGKTALSIELAKRINGEIISADSIQVYKYMDIGSAKITHDEMNGIKHYLIDEFNPDEDFNIYIFKEKAKKYIEEIYNNGKIPIIAGGTGFYIQSLLYDIQFTEEENDSKIRQDLTKLLEEHGNVYIHNLLKEVDPESASLIHPNNSKRVIRALEFFRLNNKKISLHNTEQENREAAYNFKYYVLNMDRKLLYERINKRVDQMALNGLIDEVKHLLAMGYNKNLTSMQGIGYKEVVSYLEGDLTLDEMIDLIKKDTRHFAKRQLTWFRREEDVSFINQEDFDFNTEKILEYMIDDLHNVIM